MPYNGGCSEAKNNLTMATDRADTKGHCKGAACFISHAVYRINVECMHCVHARIFIFEPSVFVVVVVLFFLF